MCSVYLSLSRKLINYALGALTSITTHQNVVKMEREDKSKNHSTKNIVQLNYVTSEGATEVKLLPSVEELLKNIVAKEGFISHEISRTEILNKGSSYLGDLFEINIRGETKDGPKEMNAFLKQVIVADETMNILSDFKTCYSKEVLFYSELSDIFSALQNSVNMPDKEKFQIAKSYECNSDAIILENLCKKGFETLNFLDVMLLNFAEQSIEQLAKLNGLAFVMKKKRKNYFDKKIKTLKPSMYFDEVKNWKDFAKKIIEISTAHFTRDTQQKIDYFLQNSFYVKFPKYFTGDTDSVKFLCHGDFRISNVMMKKSGKEVILIDYQILFYGSPVTDLLYFLYTGTDRKFTKAHMNYLKDLYHNKLSELLKYFDIDINDVYPKNVYEKDFENSLDFGLMVALYICPILFLIPDLYKDKVNHKSIKMDDRFKERINEVVEEFIEWGILK